MSLEKVVLIDKIEAIENGCIQVRQVTRIMEDGKELSSSYHRWVLTPGQATTGQDPRVVAICNIIWTPEVIAEHQAREAARHQEAMATANQGA